MIKKTRILALILLFALAIGMAGAAMWDLKDIITGDQMVPSGAPWFADNAKMYFGTDKDGYIWFNSGTGYAELSGISLDYTGGLALTAGNDLTVGAAGDSKLDFHLGTGTTDTTTGTNTLNGNTVIEGTHTLTTGTGAVNINGATALNAKMTVASGVDIVAAAAGSDIDYSLATTGIFITPGGAITIGPGAVGLTGTATVASGKDIIAAGGASDIDYSLSSGFFKTPTGTTTLNGPVSVGSGIDVVAVGGASDIDYSLSSGFFKSPVGANTLSGTTTILADQSLIMAAGSGAVNFGSATGTFSTPTGAATHNGDTTISGSKTFTSGTGAVTLKGNTAVDAGKTTTLGPTIHRTTTSAVNVTISDTANDYFFVGGNTTGIQVITMPTAADNVGREITIILTSDPGSAHVMIDGEGAETVDGAATKTTTDAIGTMYSLISNGAGWFQTAVKGTWT